jgi:hypothetical protein
MNLVINWNSPVPQPECGYEINYRRNYDPAYTSVNTSGATSGNTVSEVIKFPACYEGYIQSDCCSENLSEQVGFGYNAYSTFTLSIIASPNGYYQATITSTVTNPYPTLIKGTFDATTSGGTGTIFQLIYPANVLNNTQTFGSFTPGSYTVSNLNVNFNEANFDQGGQLQQFDSVFTPPYTKLYWVNNTSGATWNGSPIELPSFILRAFNVTAVDTGGSPLQGNLLISWISGSLYHNAVSPYDRVTFKVYDPDLTLMGTTTVFPLSNGLQNTVIALTKSTSTIGPGTQFKMTTEWGNAVISSTKLFNLPAF